MRALSSGPSPRQEVDRLVDDLGARPKRVRPGVLHQRESSESVDFASEDSRFLRCAVRYLVMAGVRQFVDIRRGMPTCPQTHLVVEKIDPAAHVVYVDDNPLVLARTRRLLADDGKSKALCAEGGMDDPEALLAASQLRILDWSRPVALMLIGVLHLIPDDQHAYASVRRLLDTLAPGSFLMISHPAAEFCSPELDAALRTCRHAGVRTKVRSRAEVGRFFEGLELLDPGIELTSLWQRGPLDGQPPSREKGAGWAAVGRVPVNRWCPRR